MAQLRGSIKKIIIVVCSIIFTLGILEIVFRIKSYVEDQQILTEERLKEREPIQHARVALADIIRISQNEGIIYEMKPNLDVAFMQIHLMTNSEGFRDKEYRIAKNENTVRIVGIGDSIMFGWEVPEENSYLAVLEEMLNKNYGQKTWEIINMAVPGYNTWMEIDTLKQKGLKYKPDIVIVGFCVNDIDLPNFIRNNENYFTVEKSFLKEFVTLRLKNMTREKKGILVRADSSINNGYGFIRFESDLSKVPANYKYMIGWNGFNEALKELKKLSVEHNFEVIFVFARGRPKEALQKATVLGFHVIDNGQSITKYMMKHEIKNYMGSVMSIAENDPHPSVITHELIAEDILSFMEKRGIIKHRIPQL